MFFLGTQAGRSGRAALAAAALAALAVAAGCSGPSISWAGALGSGVTVVLPGPASAGNDSPQGVMIGVAAAFSTGHFADLCAYERPSAQSSCSSSWGSASFAVKVDLADFPIGTNVKPGYAAIDGDKALIGLTGRVCVLKDSPACFVNRDPAAILDSGKSFRQLWSQAHRSSGEGNVYSLSSAVKVSGKWYASTVNGSIDTF